MALNAGERIEYGFVKDADGRMVVAMTPRTTVKYAAISMSTAADNTVVAAVAGKRIGVLNYVLVVAGATTLTWKSAANVKSGAMSLGANGQLTIGGEGAAPVMETNTGEALVLTPGSAVQVSGHVAYIEV